MGVSHVHVQQTNPVRVNVWLLVFGAAALRWHGSDSAGGGREYCTFRCCTVGGRGVVAGNNPRTLGNTRSSFESVLIIVHNTRAPGGSICEPIGHFHSKMIKRKKSPRSHLSVYATRRLSV